MNDATRVKYALIVAVAGLLVPAALTAYFASLQWKANDIATVVGLFTSVVGTLVGLFLGVQVGAAGKQKAEQLAQRALGELSADKAREVIELSNR